jgi:hypothetical protein
MNTKTDSILEAEVKKTVENLIEYGTSYNVEKLKDIYDDGLKIVKIDEKGNVEAITKQETLDFFASKRAAGDEPLSKETLWNYVEANENTGHVIVTRYMKMNDRPEKSVFSLHLEKKNGRWVIVRETAFVQPE